MIPAIAVLLSIHLPAHATTLTDTDLGAMVVLTTPELTVTVEKAPFRVAVTDASGTLLEQAADPTQASLAYFRGASEYRVVQLAAPHSRTADRVELDCDTSEGVGMNALVAIEFVDDGTFFIDLIPATPLTVTEVADTFVAPAGERYYGLTERIVTGPGRLLDFDSEVVPQEVGSLDRRGELVHMSVAATISIYTPFFHSSKGYGLFVDGPMQGTFDFANSAADRLRIRFNFDPAVHRFRYHFFHGPSHARILDHYTALTGRPWLPPRWAYRHMRWRDEHAGGATALLDGVPMNAALVEDVEMYEALRFPAPGWYNFDRPWTAGAKGGCPGAGFARFGFDPVRFPNAAQMIAALGARGTRTIVFNAPWACGDPGDPADNAYEATLQGYYAPNSPDHIDFTNPAATAWWQDQFGAFVTSMGISGFKLDRGDETVPSTSADIYADGRTGLELHNDYPRLYVKAYHDRLQAIRPDDWVTMTRPGYAGSQAYGLYWGGDTTGANTFGVGAGTDKGLRSAIISLQRLAFMGFPNWGTDTGGYYQFKQRDVFARWLQFSAFTPVMEIGGGLNALNATGGPHAPWNMPTIPNHDEEMIDIYRYYTWLHHELVPYAYSEALRANETGHPIATPLVFDYPDDPNVADLWQQYLYGPWLMVAPVWRDGARTQSVYLPAGAWTDYWDDSISYAGPTSLSAVAAPLGRIPLFIKLGAVIPLEVESAVTGHGTAASAGRLTLDMFPHLTSSYTVRESGGAITVTSAKAGTYDAAVPVAITTSSATKDYLLRVKTNFKPASLTLDASPLTACADQLTFDDPMGSCDWLYQPGGRTLVKYSTVSASATVELTPGDPLLCGNGATGAGEECDDGNVTDGDGCSSACRFEPLHHAKCYRARTAHGAPRFQSQAMVLQDEIETRNMTAVKPQQLCSTEGVNGPAAQMACYRITDEEGQPEFARQEVTVQDQFGDLTLTLFKPRFLCAPSQVDGVPVDFGVDHFKCYKARMARGTPRFTSRERLVTAGFETKQTIVLRPVAFCTPVQKGEQPARDAGAYRMCYRIKDVAGQTPFSRRNVNLTDSFGTQTLTAVKSRTLCVPTTRM